MTVRYDGNLKKRVPCCDTIDTYNKSIGMISPSTVMSKTDNSFFRDPRMLSQKAGPIFFQVIHSKEFMT